MFGYNLRRTTTERSSAQAMAGVTRKKGSSGGDISNRSDTHDMDAGCVSSDKHTKNAAQTKRIAKDKGFSGRSHGQSDSESIGDTNTDIASTRISSARGCNLIGDTDFIPDNTFDDDLEVCTDSMSRLDDVEDEYFRDANNNAIRNITDVLSFDKRLGQGVYGDVFLCHLRADRTKKFAVKRIQQAPSPVENIFGLDQNIVKELHALRSLKRPHANIVRLYDFCSAMEAVVPRNGSKPSQRDTKRKCVAFYLIFELCDMDLNQFVREASLKYKAHEMDLFSCTSEHTDGEYHIQDIINQWSNVYLQQKQENTERSSEEERPKKDEKIPLPALNEDVVKVIMYQMLQGLAYIHSNRIIHRDIKPQNILLKKPNGTMDTVEALQSPNSWQVKIGDLGLSTIIPARYIVPMTEEVVTLLYRPPELLLGDCKYTTAVDIWSTAASVGECLLGKPMFRARTEFSVLMRIICTVGTPKLDEMPELAKKLKYLTDSMPKVERDSRESLRKMFTDHFGRRLLSETGIDLFEKMLKFVPSERITAEQALQHPWFEDIDKLLKPSVAKSYHKIEHSFPNGQRGLLPLHFKGNLQEYQSQVRRTTVKETSVDDRFMQFVFP